MPAKAFMQHEKLKHSRFPQSGWFHILLTLKMHTDCVIPRQEHRVGSDPAHIWPAWNPCGPDLGRYWLLSVNKLHVWFTGIPLSHNCFYSQLIIFFQTNAHGVKTQTTPFIAQTLKRYSPHIQVLTNSFASVRFPFDGLISFWTW